MSSSKKFNGRLRSVLIGSVILFILYLFNQLMSERYPAPVIYGRNSGVKTMMVENSIRVATYNIHRGKGTDKSTDLGRISDAIRQAKTPDIIALQEVAGPNIWHKANQATQLANNLNLKAVFAATEYRWLRLNQGNAVLSKAAPAQHQSIALPYDAVIDGASNQGRSYRNMLIATYAFSKGKVAVLSTHLDTSVMNQVQANYVFEQFNDICQQVNYCVLLADMNNEHDSEYMHHQIKKYDLIDATKNSAKQFKGRNVDWILTKGLSLKNSGFIDKGPSDHGLFWADLSFNELQ